jgi:uncharacterized protein involved in exopolysaccharide biosynthesis
MALNKYEFDSSNVFFFFIRWWKHLAIVCFLGLLVGVIFSAPAFITPMFESRATMFPAMPSSLSKSVIMAWSDFGTFGEKEESERILEVLKSANLRDRVAEHFNLMSHYKIPADSEYPRTMLIGEYQKNFKYSRSQYGAIEVRVRDRDPELAAEMANFVSAMVDTVLNDIRYKRLKLAHDVAEKEYMTMHDQRVMFQDSLRAVMGKGVLDIESQVMMLTRQLAMDLSGRNSYGSEALENRLKTVGEYGGQQMYQSGYLNLIVGDLMVLQRRYQEAQADLINFLPFKYDIDGAYPAEKKSYPVRWLIVFLTTFGAGFMGIMVLITFENLLKLGIIPQKEKPATSK